MNPALGFYVQQVWWIDQFKIKPGHFYRYSVAGRNGWRDGETFSWAVPGLRGFAFALRVVS